MKSGFCPNHVLRESSYAAWAALRRLKGTLDVQRASCGLPAPSSHYEHMNHRSCDCPCQRPQLAVMHAARSPTAKCPCPRSECRSSTEQASRSHRLLRPRRQDPLPKRSTAPLRSVAEIALLKGTVHTDTSAPPPARSTFSSTPLRQDTQNLNSYSHIHRTLSSSGSLQVHLPEGPGQALIADIRLRSSANDASLPPQASCAQGGDHPCA